jgi:hypothetical protein
VDVVEFVRRQRAIVIVVGVVIALVGGLGLLLDWGASSKSSAAPATTSSSSGASRASSSPASSATETPDEFFAAFTTALKNGDTAFLSERAHPAVIARYGTAQCAAFVEQLVDPSIDLHIVSVSEPGPFDYASDGKSTVVPDTYVFHVDGSAGNTPGPRDFHFALVDGQFRLFVDCGTPV